MERHAGDCGSVLPSTPANAKVLPICPFIAEWIVRHPDYEDLVFKNRSQVND
jgi:predicted GNAT family acetyltransferase